MSIEFPVATSWLDTAVVWLKNCWSDVKPEKQNKILGTRFLGFCGVRVTLKYEKDFCFHEKELGVYVVDWFTGITYYCKYKMCSDDILNCFGETFATFFRVYWFCFYFFTRKGLWFFRKRTSGSQLISIYGDYFIIITSLKKKYFE